MCWDTLFKIAYYSYSRFASVELMQVYQAFLVFRPMLIFILGLYIGCLSTKSMVDDYQREKKKFKDDISYQKDLVMEMELGVKAPKPKTCKDILI